MNLRSIPPRSWPRMRRAILSVGWISLLGAGPGAVLAQESLSPDELDALVAPIALYPDALLTQTLVAATYPLEIIQLQQWLAKNPDLKDEALVDAVAQQPWDPAIQSMAAVPEVVERLANDVQWTTGLGNAFLAQQSEVMDAAQRMRGKAQRGWDLSLGDYGLQTLEPGWITARQIEAARVAITRHIKRGGKVWIRLFPDKPITKKPAEVRMGKGKGAIDGYVAVVKPGRKSWQPANAATGSMTPIRSCRSPTSMAPRRPMVTWWGCSCVALRRPIRRQPR